MIVTCPNCTARYKVPESKISDRGAKITCPNCSHKFVIAPEGAGGQAAGPAKPPGDLARRDFRKVGIAWKVRRTIGLTYDFYDLATLREYMSDNQVGAKDELSWDHKRWTPLGTITDLEAHFWDIWQQAERGEIASPREEKSSEDDSDAPTTIVGQGSSLADEIRRAVADVATPAPAGPRTPSASPRGPTPAQASQAASASPPELPPLPDLPPVASAPAEFKKLTAAKAEAKGGGGLATVAAVLGLVVVVALLLAIVVGMLYLLGVFGQ